MSRSSELPWQPERILTETVPSNQILDLPRGLPQGVRPRPAWSLRAFQDIPSRLIRTLTSDNGTEFSGHKQLEEALGCAIYFAVPRSPWQRGQNENTYGLLRQYFPKGSDFRKLDAVQIANAVNEINRRPRKKYQFKSLHELLMPKIHALLKLNPPHRNGARCGVLSARRVLEEFSMSNRLSMAKITSIETLHRSGHSNREIAKLLSIDRGTVNKYVQQLGAAAQNRPNLQTGADVPVGLPVTDGTMISQCQPRHRHQEWLKRSLTSGVNNTAENDLPGNGPGIRSAFDRRQLRHT